MTCKRQVYCWYDEGHWLLRLKAGTIACEDGNAPFIHRRLARYVGEQLTTDESLRYPFNVTYTSLQRSNCVRWCDLFGPYACKVRIVWVDRLFRLACPMFRVDQIVNYKQRDKSITWTAMGQMPTVSQVWRCCGFGWRSHHTHVICQWGLCFRVIRSIWFPWRYMNVAASGLRHGRCSNAATMLVIGYQSHWQILTKLIWPRHLSIAQTVKSDYITWRTETEYKSRTTTLDVFMTRGGQD
jgi:hypothetical protein